MSCVDKNFKKKSYNKHLILLKSIRYNNYSIDKIINTFLKNKMYFYFFCSMGNQKMQLAPLSSLFTTMGASMGWQERGYKTTSYIRNKELM